MNAIRQFALGLSFIAVGATAGWAKASPRRAWIPIGESHAVPLRGGHELWKTITEEIGAAEKSIDIESRTLRNKDVQALLVEKLKEGVAVRIIAMDPRKQFRHKPNKGPVVEASMASIKTLTDAGAEISEYPLDRLRQTTKELGPENHRKLIVIDKRRAFLTTSDLTHNTSNFDVGLLLRGKAVKELDAIWNQDHDQATNHGHGTKAKPASVKTARALQLLDGRALKTQLFDLIRKSDKQIVIGAYEFTDRSLLQLLVEKKQQHPTIDIKVVLGPQFLTSKILGILVKRPMNLEAYRTLTKHGIEVAWGDYKPNDGPGAIFHAKFAVIDGKDLVLGSADFNNRSFAGNHELSAIARDQPALAEPFLESLLAKMAAGHTEPVHSWIDRVKNTLIEAGVSLATELNASFG